MMWWLVEDFVPVFFRNPSRRSCEKVLQKALHMSNFATRAPFTRTPCSELMTATRSCAPGQPSPEQPFALLVLVVEANQGAMCWCASLQPQRWLREAA